MVLRLQALRIRRSDDQVRRSLDQPLVRIDHHRKLGWYAVRRRVAQAHLRQFEKLDGWR